MYYNTGSLKKDLDDKFSKRFELEHERTRFESELDKKLFEDAKKRAALRQRVRALTKPKEIPHWALVQTEEYLVAEDIVSDLISDLKHRFEKLISQFKSELTWTMLSEEQREKLLEESRTMTSFVGSPADTTAQG